MQVYPRWLLDSWTRRSIKTIQKNYRIGSAEVVLVSGDHEGATMDSYENEVIILRLMLDGRHNNARAIVQTLPKERLQKLSDVLDYYAVLVDDQLLRVDKR